ncbi:phage related-protein [Alteracholeplasma palmae J233]|uniref:Phage related-protein n=1 Tax=Alteracholeplasma palmae (strain ATCC 49389 / J233) TaxID=1318466 RepID=U4KKU9_ALTPJ|nr:hypothetical protein [Alteracholeplasma palmae]CCV64327.1 phage related-protein [Alteracholeplasma palmae J233]
MKKILYIFLAVLSTLGITAMFASKTFAAEMNADIPFTTTSDGYLRFLALTDATENRFKQKPLYDAIGSGNSFTLYVQDGTETTFSLHVGAEKQVYKTKAKEIVLTQVADFQALEVTTDGTKWNALNAPLKMSVMNPMTEISVHNPMGFDSQGGNDTGGGNQGGASKLLLDGMAVVNDINFPYSINDIARIAKLRAIDPKDGDITNKVVITNENFSGNENKLGTYYVEYSVTNSSQNTTTKKISISNHDLTGPDIDGPSQYKVRYTDSLNVTEFLKNYSATDKIDGDTAVYIEKNDYKNRTFGKFSIVIASKDKAGNISRKNVVIDSYDNLAPSFEDKTVGPIVLDLNAEITDKILLEGLTATDEIDGDVTSLITVVTHNIVSGSKGVYEVEYLAVDKSGNGRTHYRTYRLESNIYTAFWVDRNIVSLDALKTLTIDQIARIYATYEGIEMKSYKVITDKYSENASVEGHYLVSMLITDKEGKEHKVSRTLSVAGLKKDEDVKLGFWATIWRAIKNFFIDVINSILNFLNKLGLNTKLIEKK